MEEKEYFNSGLNQRQAIIDPARDKQVASHVYQCLLPLRNYFAGLDDETRALEGLIEFIQSLYNQIPIPSAEDQFQVLHPLRTWLFFQPIDFLRRGQEEITGMVLLAHFFGVALAVEPLFPAVGAAYFGTMSVGPIEQIHQNLLVRQTTSRRSREIHDALSLMRFPLQMVKEFRDRMSWSRVDHLAATSPVGHRSTMPTHSSHQSHSPYPPETPMINYDWQAFGNFTSPTTSGGHAPQYHSPHDVHRSHAASDFIAEAMWRMER